jgi:hypothetical protein
MKNSSQSKASRFCRNISKRRELNRLQELTCQLQATLKAMPRFPVRGAHEYDTFEKILLSLGYEASFWRR